MTTQYERCGDELRCSGIGTYVCHKEAGHNGKHRGRIEEKHATAEWTDGALREI